MVLLLAGLQQIPKELGEAASIDGATSWQKFRYVTLPLLGPDHSCVDLLVDHRRAAVVRPRVGHHQGRTDRVVVHDGDLPLRPVPQEPVRLRQRGVDRDLRALAGRRAALPTVRAATRLCRGPVSLAELSIASRQPLARPQAAPLAPRPARSVRRRHVRARHHHLAAHVLGARRVSAPTSQLVEQPGRSAQPVGVRQLHQHPDVELVLATGVEQHVHRAR